jgi:hypothetical protein
MRERGRVCGVLWGFSRVWAIGRRFGRKTQKGPTKFLCMYVQCTLLPPAAELCAGLAVNFCQKLATVTSASNGMVWLTVCYFTAGRRVGRGKG